jgi:hypothetical protein
MIVINFALAILGAATVVWWNAARNRQRFDARKWVDENIEAIAFTAFGIMLVAMVYMLNPLSLDVFKSLTGLSLSETPAAWFTFGVSLYEIIRKFKMSKR